MMPASSRFHKRPGPAALGRRGEGWLFLQVVLMALVGLSTLSSVSWPEPLASTLALAGLALIAGGLMLLAVAAISLIAARAMTPLARPRERASLARGGAYRLVRHPVYGALILIAVGSSLAGSPVGLLPTALLALVVDRKARVEETWFERSREYAEYRTRTPRRFLPGIY
jgi:protein-S-isoprenylcysteine O-methyltransferase Ste14